DVVAPRAQRLPNYENVLDRSATASVSVCVAIGWFPVRAMLGSCASGHRRGLFLHLHAGLGDISTKCAEIGRPFVVLLAITLRRSFLSVSRLVKTSVSRRS